MYMTQLRYFVNVANTLNFRESARRLGVSQSSVSRHISDLENRLGVALFVRTKRSVTMTDEGTAYLPYALDILGTVESSEFLMQHYKNGMVGHISVSTLSTTSAAMVKCLDVFFKRYPSIVVDVSLNTASDQVLAMTETKYDFLFAHKDMIPADDRLDWIVTHKDEMAIVVPKGHPLTKKALDFKDLENERFIISMEPGSPVLYKQIMEICRAHDYMPNLVNRYDKVESVMLAISAGLGISIMPSALPKVFFSNSVDIIPIRDMDTDRTYIAAWPKRTLNPASKLFLEVVRECFGEIQ